MPVKKLNSGYRLIKVLKLLSQKPLSMDEICTSLYEEDIDITKETISKYFSTLREFGTVIEKKKNKFSLKYPLSTMEFTKDELKILAQFEKIAHDLYSKSDYKMLKNVYNKLFNLTNNECRQKYEEILKTDLSSEVSYINDNYIKQREKIEELSKCINEGNRKLKIEYKKHPFNVIPKSIKYMKENIYLYAYDTGTKENKLFLLDKIDDFSILPQMATGAGFSYSTTFKIYKRLTKTYDARDGEIVEDFGDYQVITNKHEDKEQLFKRLLRYCDLCEIIYPKTDREKFISLVDSMLFMQSSNKN